MQGSAPGQNVVVLGNSLGREFRGRGFSTRAPGRTLGLCAFSLQLVSLAVLYVANGGIGPISESKVTDGFRPNPVWNVRLAPTGRAWVRAGVQEAC